MTAMPDYLAPWSTLRADGRITIGPAPDPGQRYWLSTEAEHAVAWAAFNGGPRPYLQLNPDGVTLDLCPPTPTHAPETPPAKPQHADAASPSSEPDTTPATSAATPSTTSSPTPATGPTPPRSSETRSGPEQTAATPPTQPTSEPRTGGATPAREQPGPTQPGQPPQPDETGPPSSSTTGDAFPYDLQELPVQAMYLQPGCVVLDYIGGPKRYARLWTTSQTWEWGWTLAPNAVLIWTRS